MMVAADPDLYELSASEDEDLPSLSLGTVSSRATEDFPPLLLPALLLVMPRFPSTALLLFTPMLLLLAPFFESSLRSTLDLSRVTEHVVVLMLPWWLEYDVSGAELLEILLVS